MPTHLDAATQAAVTAKTIYPAWVIRLDILGDPVQVWTGRGPLTLTGTGDSALDGYTFEGIGLIGEIGEVTDTREGSDTLRLGLPGVDLQDDALRQVVFDQRTWQFRRAWMWIVLLDANGAVVGKPIRVKSGRMDRMNHQEDGGVGKITLEVESHQSYASEALFTRYSENKEIDSTDTSQDYAPDLANKTAGVGVKDAASSGTSASDAMARRFLHYAYPNAF